MEETAALRDIQKLIGKNIPVEENHPYHTQFHGITKRPAKVQQQRPPRQGSFKKKEGTGNGGPKNSGAPRSGGAPKKRW
jgi:ATP-dependent RNA helicase RhlE